MGHAPDTFGVRLIKAQNRAEMSCAKLASTINASPTVVSNFRMDKHGTSVEMLKKICTALNVSADFLLGLSDEPQVR